MTLQKLAVKPLHHLQLHPITGSQWEGGLCCSRGLETSHHSCIEDPELIHFLVALAVFHQDDLMKRMN